MSFEARPVQRGDEQPVSLGVDDRLAHRAAQAGCTILLTGETGAGKGHLARWLHDNSLRHDRPFTPVNCGAIPETLIDSQLFGHARGAFSGATAEHPGLVRAADGGTLLLDEIGELPPSAQTRLLRLLQELEVQPVGYAHPVIVDVRVIAATSVDLAQAVSEQHFREDLMFRLDVIQLNVGPLRDRPEDVLRLIDSFNAEFASLYSQSPLQFDDRAMTSLRDWPWPGNIRQLRTVIERLHVLCPGALVTERALQETARIGATAAMPAPDLGQLRRDEVRRVLDASGGCVTRAADLLGVHRSTIYRWLKNEG